MPTPSSCERKRPQLMTTSRNQAGRACGPKPAASCCSRGCIAQPTYSRTLSKAGFRSIQTAHPQGGQTVTPQVWLRASPWLLQEGPKTTGHLAKLKSKQHERKYDMINACRTKQVHIACWSCLVFQAAFRPACMTSWNKLAPQLHDPS